MHLFRAVYATLSVYFYCPQHINSTLFKAEIQGHRMVADASTKRALRSYSASRHYNDYYVADSNGNVDGRQGVRLGGPGVQLLEVFKTLSFDDSDKRWLAYLRAHVGNLELLPTIVAHWERTAKPISRPLKVEELCKAFVLYRESKGLDKATLSEDRYISRRLQKHLGGHMAHELGVAEIRSFLDSAKTSDSLEHKLTKSAH